MSAPTKPFNWRTDAFHPDCRRAWAELTDTRTYHGPHNITAEDVEPARFLGFHWLVPVVPALLAAVLWIIPQ